MIRRTLSYGLIAIVLVGVSGCGTIFHKQDAKKVIESYFSALRRKNYDEALNYYSAEFLRRNKPAYWLDILKSKIPSKMGDLQSFELEDWTGWKGGKSKEKNYVAFKYKVVYTKTVAREVFTFRRTEKGQTPKIKTHTIESSRFTLKT